MCHAASSNKRTIFSQAVIWIGGTSAWVCRASAAAILLITTRRKENTPSILSTTQHTLSSRLGSINSAFESVGKSINNVHPGLFNYNHLIIVDEIHEQHIAIPKTNSEVTTRFDHGGCTRVRSFSLPSCPWYVIHRAWSSSLFLVGYMSSSSDMVRRENIGVLWNRLIEVNHAKVAMGALEVWRMV